METISRNAKDIFIDLIGNVPPREWDARLEQVCQGDAALLRRVKDLMSAHVQTGSFLDEPVIGVDADVTVDFAAEAPGASIGPYKLLEPIGEGGMGVVYMAEQTRPVRRKVALKVIKPGMDSKQVVARFEAERQALALMDHPNIAKVHDAGTTESGRPYFVMELVRGIPITEYCDQNRLSIDDRLDLFILVCQAVQHAHQKGVIHRDIKPSNVLITLHDGVPVPKVIDFGVAKATGSSLTDRTLFTGFAQLIGTPLYMSPEQAELSGLDIDTRSDIYSLGVLLYELLTGTTPFDQDTFRTAALDEMRRIIREQEPPKPSTRLSTLGETLTTVSANRHVDARKLSHALRGELDWIVMKALEKDRKRRYESASGFAADVRRYLADQPVEACPPSAWYRFAKAARRNRVALTTVGLVAGALLLGLAVSVAMAARARAAERRTAVALGQARAHLAEADRQRAQARKAVDEMYTQVAEKWLSRGGSLTPLQRDFLEKALAFYEEFARARADDAEARTEAARAAARVGEIRSKLGETAGALEAHGDSLAGFRRLAAEFPDRPEYRRGMAKSLHDIGQLHEQLGRMRDAERSLREALTLRERLAKDPGTPGDRADLAASHRSLGSLFGSIGRGVDGERVMKQSIDLLNKLVAEHPRELRYQGELASSENNLGVLFHHAERNAEAEKQYRRALELRRGLADADPADPEHQLGLAIAYHNLGSYFRSIYRPEQAVEEYRRALPVEEKLVADHPERPRYRSMLSDTLSVLSDQLVRCARFDEAEDALRRSRDLGERLANDFPDVPHYRDRMAVRSADLGAILAQRGRDREARVAFERAYEVRRRLVKEFPDLSDYRHNLAATCYQMAVNYDTLKNREPRDVARARELAREAVAIEPDEPGFWKGLALAEYRAGDLDAALKAEARSLELREKGGYAYDWLILALIHLDRGDRGQARAWAENTYGKRAPGTISGQEPDFTRLARESEPRLRALLDGDADVPRPGETPSRPGGEAHAAGVAEEPGFLVELASSYLKSANALLKQGRTEAAKEPLEHSREILEGLVTRFPDRAEYQTRYMWLAQGFLSQPPFAPLHDPEWVLKVARRAAEMRPEDQGSWKWLGLAEYRNGHWDAAIESTKRCIELRGGQPYEFQDLVLALCHGQKGELEPARACYDRAVERIRLARKRAGTHIEPVVESLLAEAEALLGVSHERKPPG